MQEKLEGCIVSILTTMIFVTAILNEYETWMVIGGVCKMFLGLSCIIGSIMLMNQRSSCIADGSWETILRKLHKNDPNKFIFLKQSNIFNVINIINVLFLIYFLGGYSEWTFLSVLLGIALIFRSGLASFCLNDWIEFTKNDCENKEA